MSEKTAKGGNVAAIATMFALFFMIAFVTNFASPMGSGIFMAMVFGGILIPVQGLLADKMGILNSYWLSIGLLAYVLFYALVLSRPAKRADKLAE